MNERLVFTIYFVLLGLLAIAGGGLLIAFSPNIIAKSISSLTVLFGLFSILVGVRIGVKG